MNRLWIFGDSYGELNDSFGPNQWQLLLAEQLNCDELHNVTKNGSSCMWLLLKWHEFIAKFKPSDKIIVLVPFYGRSLIFKDNPQLSAITTLDMLGKEKRVDDKWKPYSKSQIDAFKKYFMYLYDPDINLSIAFGLLNTVNNCATMFKTPPLIINTTEDQMPVDLLYNCTVASGSTIHINTNEFETKEIWKDIANCGLFLDTRVCHMSEPNHIVFTKKMKDYFVDNVIPDLSTEFHKKILSKKDIER
tara:strand:- start:51 stop:791 length:741 start_codon:yes stop_codon:yes gene_type:complete